MTTNETTVTQAKREAVVSMDITKPIEKISTTNNKELITRPTWDAAKSAAEAQARVEAQVRASHQRQLEIEKNDPTLNRVLRLEAAVERIEFNLAQLIARFEGGNANV